MTSTAELTGCRTGLRGRRQDGYVIGAAYEIESAAGMCRADMVRKVMARPMSAMRSHRPSAEQPGCVLWAPCIRRGAP